MSLFNFFKRKKKAVPLEQDVERKVQISVAYSYEWKESIPQEERDTPGHESRPFCKKLIELNRYYTRAEIEKMSEHLGYSVWDRCGGVDCRHMWKSNIVTREKK
jgi:hypothetical protein